ncbi:MAG: 4Fe-4S dicluster domain-containing protein [Omnitrophica bacterium]|nr:4Fe-4S dicluster domain-containing protein [Candidatus Omnitrophota bacterium]
MSTGAQQLYNGKLNIEPQKGSDARLFIDLDVCASGECKDCVVKCSYFYHPANNGIATVVELATYALVCRKCEEPHCVNSCPFEAIEQQKEKDNMLIRHNMRCVSCKSCSHACPYGAIYPENVPFLVHNCDFCLDRREKTNEPLCIQTCPYGALSLKNGDIKLDENTFLVGDNIIVHSRHWQRQNV